jgi:predicted lactoylglutathione lyase
VEAIVKKAAAAGGAPAAAAAKAASLVDKAKASDGHRWFIGKMDPAEKARRQKEAEEFRQRYAR